jgi:uncharacterized protein (TIGR02145 family)
VKKKLKYILIFLLSIIGLNSYAQAPLNCPGDSVYLELPTFSGSIQWQESSDSITWTNISGANYQPYGFVFTSAKFYRAMVTASGCSPIYSPIKTILQEANCPVYAAGTIFCSGAVTKVNDVTSLTGKIWMDRNLGASRSAIDSTDSNSYGDLYQWGRISDGHQCRNSTNTNTLSSNDQPGNGNFILAPSAPADWRNPQNTNLWQGVNGVNNPCPSGYRIPTEIECIAEDANFTSQNSSGAFGSPIKFSMAGSRDRITGSLISVGTYGGYWISTISANGSLSMAFSSSNALISNSNRANGRSVRCIKEATGTISALNCGSATQTGNLISGQLASAVTVTVPYTGGDGGYYAAQNIASSGVTGLTAVLTSGNFANGSGNLNYTINGTPSNSGTAGFAISIGGQSCTLSLTIYGLQPAYPAGTVHCGGVATIVNNVTSPTGKIWMDRNLGASRVAQSSTDANAYGDLYQWGRRADGHQCRNSTTTSTLSSTDQPGNSSFIITTIPNDWRSPQNDNLWQGVNGVNNPCPSGYRIPTETELNAERLSFSSQNSVGAFASLLKFTVPGNRAYNSGGIALAGNSGYYWSSSVNTTNSRYLNINSSASSMNLYQRAGGFSVRCIKD